MNFPVASIIPMQFQECKMCQTILFMRLPRNDPRIRHGSTQSKSHFCCSAASDLGKWGTDAALQGIGSAGQQRAGEFGTR